MRPAERQLLLLLLAKGALLIVNHALILKGYAWPLIAVGVGLQAVLTVLLFVLLFRIARR